MRWHHEEGSPIGTFREPPKIRYRQVASSHPLASAAAQVLGNGPLMELHQDPRGVVLLDPSSRTAVDGCIG